MLRTTTPHSDAPVVDVVDYHDERIGVLARSELFRAKANFRVAHILLHNDHGDILIQQLAPGRDRHPGQWGSSAATYVLAGETYAMAAQRCVREELGISPALRWAGKTSMLDEGCTKFIGVFVGQTEHASISMPEHIAALEFVALEQLDALQHRRERSFTPTFVHVLNYARHHLRK